MHVQHLSSEERQFLDLVSQSVFANPFGEERIAIDLKISGVPKLVSMEERFCATHARISRFLANLDEKNRSNLGNYTGLERDLLAHAHLWDIFHRFLDKIDETIQQQIAHGDESCRTPFAGEALKVLRTRGFSQPEALHDIAVFYQVRRAYFFIHCSLAGRSSAMRQLRQALWNNVFTYDPRRYDRQLWNRMEDFSTFLLGETGSGKGAAARAIGRSGFIPFDEKSGRFAESFMRSFIATNLSQFSETLIESELFGHRKGAFTGAAESHDGLFALCSQHGAIFLDEIGDVGIPLQIKLLKVIEERVFSPVGSHDKHRFHGRVIAASNQPLDELRQKNLFRNDFFYRLCSDIITVPPLRTRLQEDPGELDDMLGIIVQRILGEPSLEFIEIVRQVIARDLGRDYPWPGNVRELEQCVRRILMTQSYKGDRRSTPSTRLSRITEAISTGACEAEALIADYCQLLYERHGTFEEVARRANLDRRTVKKHIQKAHRLL